MVVSALLAGPASAVPVGEAGQVVQVGQAGQGYGELLWMSLGLLVAIGVIAVVAVKLFGGGRLVGRGRAGGLMEVIARQPLEPRRSLYVVRVGQRRLLVGTSELGLTMLTELDEAPELEAEGEAARRGRGQAGFADLVKEAARQWTGRRTAKRAGAGGAKRDAANGDVGDAASGDVRDEAGARGEERLSS